MSRTAKIDKNTYCPICCKHEHQVRHGKKYKRYYTPAPKQHEHPEKTKKLAIEMFYRDQAAGR